MPLFEYYCQQCDATFELLIRQGERALCPQCSSAQVEKLLSVPASPVSARGNLPQANAPQDWGGCGRPQCARGGCQGM